MTHVLLVIPAQAGIVALDPLDDLEYIVLVHTSATALMYVFSIVWIGGKARISGHSLR